MHAAHGEGLARGACRDEDEMPFVRQHGGRSQEGTNWRASSKLADHLGEGWKAEVVPGEGSKSLIREIKAPRL